MCLVILLYEYPIHRKITFTFVTRLTRSIHNGYSKNKCYILLVTCFFVWFVLPNVHSKILYMCLVILQTKDIGITSFELTFVTHLVEMMHIPDIHIKYSICSKIILTYYLCHYATAEKQKPYLSLCYSKTKCYIPSWYPHLIGMGTHLIYIWFYHI